MGIKPGIEIEREKLADMVFASKFAKAKNAALNLISRKSVSRKMVWDLLCEKEFDEEITYTIVGSTEANPAECKISNESPVGKALLGKQAGDEVEVDAPQGTISLKILEITK